MKYYFSASTNGFYRDDLHTSDKMPADAVEITEVEFATLIDGQATGEQVIGADDNFPALLNSPSLSPEELAEKNLVQRGELLFQSDWTQLPDAPLSVEVKGAWMVYRQALRDITEQPTFPYDIDWPIAPDAI